jgi:hypothetical protein
MSTDPATTIRRCLRDGRHWFADFPGEGGLVWMEFTGKQAPRLILRAPTDLCSPIAVVDLDDSRDAIAANVQAIEEVGSKLIHGEEDLFKVILHAIRDVFLPTSSRIRIPVVQQAVTTEGSADLDAWASALSLADLQAAMVAALRQDEPLAA